MPKPFWNRRPGTFAACALMLLALALAIRPHHARLDMEEEGMEEPPSDWFSRQRAYPDAHINDAAYRRAAEQAIGLRAAFAKEMNVGDWRLVGPTNVGGRVSSLAVDPSDPATIYAGVAYGGVFKSTDEGSSWRPIFDGQPTLCVGDVAIAPSHPNIIYVGTGEANSSRIAYNGMGVFKSTDAGATWKHCGLDSSATIGRVLVDPNTPDRVYVAVAGDHWKPGSARGLYRTTDGGESWRKILFVNDSTGCVDVMLHPSQPLTLYAVTWQRALRPEQATYGGPGSAIYRSTDGGESWRKLPLPTSPDGIGRIGLAIAPSDPTRLYAVTALNGGQFGAFYASSDAGASWSEMSAGELRGSSNFYSNYGWWFGQLRVDPADRRRVYALGIWIFSSDDGGAGWVQHGQGSIDSHADHHALWIDPDDGNHLIAGNDGGVFVSHDRGDTWQKKGELPITQFYTCEVDQLRPERIFGGAQDNSTVRTLTGRANDWMQILGGDGFRVLVDPVNPDYVYAEYQYGRIFSSADGGAEMNPAMTGLTPGDRFNWNTPLAFDPADPSVLYTGSQRLYRSTDRAGTWSAISPDLSKGGNWRAFGTITAIAVAHGDANYIYAGCDDGSVKVTTDGGANWLDRSGGSLPNRWVTSIAADPRDYRRVWVTFSGYRNESYVGHVFRTTDAGATWLELGKNLPEAPVNEIVIDPIQPDLMYVATDFGVYYTRNAAGGWLPLGSGLPNVPVLDLRLHRPTNTLVAATFGRSIYSIDVSPLTSVPRDAPERGASGIAIAATGPNPFNASASLLLTLGRSAPVRVEIADLAGRHLRTLMAGRMEAGTHPLIWDGACDDGSAAAPGVYFCLARAGGEGASVRVVRMR